MNKKENPMQKILMAAFAAVLAGPLQAQNSPQMTTDLTVTMDRQQYRICNDRPARPTWMDEVHPREAYKVLTLMRLYELRAWEDIMASEQCGCDTRFPSWDSASAEYAERFESNTQAEHTQVQIELRRNQAEIARAVQDICEAQGNW